jgi:protein-tyrosine phosphatase
MVEALLGRHVAERGIQAHVSSAGLLSDGQPAAEATERVMVDHGLDLTGHRTRRLTRELVAGADLVLAMAREHVREAAVLEPTAFGRTFTLKELVRRGRAIGPRPSGETTAAWLARVHAGRTPSLHLGASPDDDVPDPIGHRMAVHERTADELVELTDALVELLWSADAGDRSGDPSRLAAN